MFINAAVGFLDDCWREFAQVPDLIQRHRSCVRLQFFRPPGVAMSIRAHVLKVFLSACCMGLLCGAAQANIVYAFNTTATNVYPSGNPLQTDTILGTLTTDGTLGVLAASNILSWDLQLIDHLDASKNFRLLPSNSEVVHVFGNALTATATGLSFDFSEAGAEFLIQGDHRGNSLHPISSGFNYFCFSATGGWCLAGESIVPDYYATDGVIVTGDAAPVGPHPLDQGPHPAPEPMTLALVAMGLLGLTGLRMGRTQQS